MPFDRSREAVERQLQPQQHAPIFHGTSAETQVILSAASERVAGNPSPRLLKRNLFFKDFEQGRCAARFVFMRMIFENTFYTLRQSIGGFGDML